MLKALQFKHPDRPLFETALQEKKKMKIKEKHKELKCMIFLSKWEDQMGIVERKSRA